MDKTNPDGVLVVDKPSGPTSHDVVLKVRAIVKGKVGHTGTLDPAATGVLPLALGRATRLVRFLQASDKEYLASVRLGISTDSYDAEGRVIREAKIPIVSESSAHELLKQFTGRITQVPPMYSAIKVKGQRLYKAARSSKVVERPSRTVWVYELELLEQSKVQWKLRIRCSSGTYIRSLAQDIGEVIGCGAHLESLRRTRSGDFDLAEATSIEKLEMEWQERVIPLEKLLPELSQVALRGNEARRFRHGNSVCAGPSLKSGPSGSYVRVLEQDRIIALGRWEDAILKPAIVLRPA